MSDPTEIPDRPPSPNTQNTIRIRGARQHNLKNIDLELPRDRLIVFTGVSGSGKSSLAFDTIFAEGQRRYVESLSAYARQFLGQLNKPDVDAIEGLSPAISIDQKSTSNNPRSTVGTVTEIYDYLRLLFGRAGEPHCPICDRSIIPQTIDEMCDRILELPDRTKFHILAPVVRGKKGTHKKLLSSLAAEGFVRVRVDGEVLELSDSIELDKNYTHNIEVVVDRLIKKPDIQERLTDSLATCLRRSGGIAIITLATDSVADVTDNISATELSQRGQTSNQSSATSVTQSAAPSATPSAAPSAAPSATSVTQSAATAATVATLIFSENFACPEHGAVMEELSPRLFSFNSPYGACPNCHGLGTLRTFSPELVVPDPTQPLYSAIAPWADKDNSYYLSLLYGLGQVYGFEIQTIWNKLTAEQQQAILYGTDKNIWLDERNEYRHYRGVIPILQRQYDESSSDLYKQKLEPYLIDQPCEVCKGKRLKPEALSVRLGQYRMTDLMEVSIRECRERIDELQLSSRQAQIGDLALKEIKARLQFLLDVGLDYLTLDRAAMTLSGGEAQRIRLATQIGSGLTGVLYVLDEPSIGLHQRDNGRLLATLKKLRDLGNTLIVVEHDEETIHAADHIIDIGPKAGIHGGKIVAQGDLETILKTDNSLTGAYLSGRRVIETPGERRVGNGRSLLIKNAHRNNLKHIDVDIPLGKLVCITGVSGSGKSTLVNELLYPALQHHLTRKVPFPKELGKVKGLEAIDK
ncbi:MAG TPA: excinuclease ABC subunit A, partial [Cyanobacteria bacterium UBA11148]|nr:excinuclease ABC subunit A [Cyanobacteria bacterium UBA11148]